MDRRSYGKVTLGLWGGLLAIAKLALDSTALPKAGHHWAVVTVACPLLVLVVVLHCLYEFKFVMRANAHDLDEALELEKFLRAEATLPEVKKDETRRRALAYFQVGVTLLLAVVAAGSIIIRSS